jgi:hypothetical protein
VTKKKPRKPTIKEMEKVINQAILMVENLRMRINNVEYITETYHEWKKEKEEFTKFLHEKTERILKDRANNDVPDNGRQEVSK